MELHTEQVRLPVEGSWMPGYLARPARVKDPLPAVLVIQEIWGVDDHIQDVVRRVAAAGYAALAPDLYARGGTRPDDLQAPRVEAAKAFLDSLPPRAWMQPGEREAAMARLPEPRRSEVAGTMGALFSPNRDMGRFAADLVAAAGFMRTHPASAGRRVGSVGYCMGGSLSALLACSDPELAGAVVYYGGGPAADRLAAIRCPLLGMYGGDDARVTDGVPAFAEAMRAAGRGFEYHVYPGAPHAFFNDTRASYRVEAARDAWARTLAFFAQHLS